MRQRRSVTGKRNREEREKINKRKMKSGETVTL